jgi:glycogen operon protein
MRIWPGSASPLGAMVDRSGVNFALLSEQATKVELCLFNAPDAEVASERIALPECIVLIRENRVSWLAAQRPAK